MLTTASDPGETLRTSAARKRLKAFRTGLLVAGSALFGGLAVVVWNRKALAKLRQPVEVPKNPPAKPDADDI